MIQIIKMKEKFRVFTSAREWDRALEELMEEE